MSAIMAPVKDGKIVDEFGSKDKVNNDKDSNHKTREVDNSMDKEAFLQLLVAQMQYQDPLEPTSNTEYVAQLATFSELEAMTNLNETMAISRASQLVGQKVVVQTKSEVTGDITQAQGTVDYVRIENNKAYLVIDEKPYPVDDLMTVMTDEYWKEYEKLMDQETSVTAQAVMAAIASLPKDVAEVTLKNKELITAIRKTYSELTTDEQRQVSTDAIVHLIKCEHQITKLEAEQAQKDEAGKKDEESSGDEGKTENTQTA